MIAASLCLSTCGGGSDWPTILGYGPRSTDGLANQERFISTITTRTMKILHRAGLSAVLLGLASLLLYTINIERAPHHDELYHILAAEGLLATGEPSIGEAGRYWRGYPVTWLVAQSFALFEPGLAAARLPAVLFMAGLVVLLFLFLHREAGALAAWLGAGLFAISPFAIELAQFVRFYSLQSLLFFAAAWIVYTDCRRALGPQLAICRWQASRSCSWVSPTTCSRRLSWVSLAWRFGPPEPCFCRGWSIRQCRGGASDPPFWRWSPPASP